MNGDINDPKHWRARAEAARRRAAPRSRASACGPHSVRRRSSTAMTSHRHCCRAHDAADPDVVGEHVEVIVAPLARMGGCGRAYAIIAGGEAPRFADSRGKVHK